MLKTIFKKDSKGKLRFISISTKGSSVVQESGLLGSENTVTNISECIGKNIGKINETTPEEQAVLEATAKIKAKLDEGYFETIEEVENEVVILPMLAKDYNKEESKVIFPCYVQPKLDGMRALKSPDNIVSRKNKLITTVPHICNGIEGVQHHTLDGELYAHGISFQGNMELIKKYRQGYTETVKYHVYDLIVPNLSFIKRYLLLKSFIEEYKPENIELVPTYVINSKEELLEKHREFLELGYEGTMVRWGDKEYEINKRSSNLLKFKDFQDIACRIVDVQPSEKRPDQGSFICEMKDGKTFGCGMRFTQEQRREVLENKENYIGKTAEIRFFEYSNDGIPRFPVCVGLRLDK